LQPDLVLTFSDLQANIVADLIRRGIEVHAFNQRTVAGILEMIRMLGAMVDASQRAEELVGRLVPPESPLSYHLGACTHAKIVILDEDCYVLISFDTN
jgi:hypothetical protein